MHELTFLLAILSHPVVIVLFSLFAVLSIPVSSGAMTKLNSSADPLFFHGNKIYTFIFLVYHHVSVIFTG
ncbi:hypothetical protein BDF14DRAFT_1835857 [Spinellus fusiger]|nr:hypothetical protein BDF14DRAFT_1835857 [Spinellus fusiger]